MEDYSDEFEMVELDEPIVSPYQHEPMADINNYSSDSADESDSDSVCETESDSDIPDVSEWCNCGNCRQMATRLENKCCQTTNIVDHKAEGLKCIVDHEGFAVNCLNIHVLETCYYDYVINQGPPEEGQLVHELYRHLAYRRFTRWVYGLLSKRCRKVVPSCAVMAIRNRFPSEKYCGFKYPQ